MGVLCADLYLLLLLHAVCGLLGAAGRSSSCTSCLACGGLRLAVCCLVRCQQLLSQSLILNTIDGLTHCQDHRHLWPAAYRGQLLCWQAEARCELVNRGCLHYKGPVFALQASNQGRALCVTGL
jgi:hypothetical protein